MISSSEAPGQLPGVVDTDPQVTITAKQAGSLVLVRDLSEAAEYITEQQPGDWELTMPTEEDVRAELRYGANGLHFAHILSPRDFVPDFQRYIGDMPDGRIVWRVLLGSEHPESSIEHDSAWVDLFADKPSSVIFSVGNDGHLNSSELDEQLQTIPEKVAEFMAAVLDNNPNPPYSLYL